LWHRERAERANQCETRAASPAAAEGGAPVRVIVDRDLCESNGVCEGLAPMVFQINDKDELDILQEHPDESLRAKVQDAVRSCPKQALTLEED
jgi:ferredoxin